MSSSAVTDSVLANGFTVSFQPITHEKTMTKLFLHPWVDTTAATLFEVLTDSEVYRYIPAPPPSNMEQFLKRHDPTRTAGLEVFSIDLPDGTSVGLFQATFHSTNTCDIGFMLGRQYWGQGFATELIRLALQELFNQKGKLTVSAKVDTRNIASIRALEKNGFTQVERCETMLKLQESIDVILTKVL